MPKAGSTAIQDALDGYDDGTTAYLRLFLANHSYGMVMIFAEEQAARRIDGGWLSSMDEWHRQALANRERLQEQIAASRKNMIISAEMLFGFQQHQIERLRDRLAPAFDRVRVIAYLREPRSFLRSLLQQNIRKRPVSLATVGMPQYRGKLEQWEAVFGHDAVDYVLFAPDTAAGQDVVADFSDRLGLTQPAPRPRRPNESMSAELFATLYALRNSPGRTGLRWPESRIKAVVDRRHEFGGHRFDFAEEVWQDRIADRKDDLAWVEGRLGRPFTMHPPHPEAVLFRSEAEILDYAAAHREDFRRWAEKEIPLERVFLTDLVRRLGGHVRRLTSV